MIIKSVWLSGQRCSLTCVGSRVGFQLMRNIFFRVSNNTLVVILKNPERILSGREWSNGAMEQWRNGGRTWLVADWRGRPASAKPKSRSHDSHRRTRLSNLYCNVDELLPCPVPTSPLQQCQQKLITQIILQFQIMYLININIPIIN